MFGLPIKRKYPRRIAAMSVPDLQRLAAEVPWYHCMDLGDGIITKGTFDLRGDLPNFGFPADMAGMEVLDVGRASGFFSFEFEKRGATVTATDIPSPIHKDYVGGDITREIVKQWVGDGDRIDFYIAHRLLKSRVTPVVATLDKLSALKKRFDLVFVGSVLNHVRDPAGALQQVFAVTKGRLIVCNPIDAADTSTIPRMKLVGIDSAALTTWFVPNIAALTHLVRASGFQNVRLVAQFTPTTTNGMKIPHAVVHAERGDEASTEEVFRGIVERHYKQYKDVFSKK